MKKIFLLSIFAPALVFSSAHVETYNQWNTEVVEEGTCAPKECEPKCAEPCAPKHCEPKCIEPCAPVYCAPLWCGWGDLTIGGDWLYWKTEQARMEFGANVTLIPDGQNQTITSEVLRPDFEYKSGFRVYAAYETCDKDWIIQAAVTHVPSHASKFLNDAETAITTDFIQIFAQNFPILTAIQGGLYETAGAEWDVTVNYFDFDVMRNICLCDTFKLQPHLGLRALWSNQTFEITGDGITQDTGDPISFVSTLKERITGFGVEGGLWGDWQLCGGFSIIGHIGGSVLYSKLTNTGNLLAQQNTSETTISYKDVTHRAIPTGDTFIGLHYTKCICKRVIDLYIGWEQHLIFDTNQFSLGGGADMSLQGLTLGGSFTF